MACGSWHWCCRGLASAGASPRLDRRCRRGVHATAALGGQTAGSDTHRLEGLWTGWRRWRSAPGLAGRRSAWNRPSFAHEAVVELDPDACETLRLNRGRGMEDHRGDIHDQDGRGFARASTCWLTGIPCPPFSIASEQLGAGDDRDLFPSRAPPGPRGQAPGGAAGERARPGRAALRRLPHPGPHPPAGAWATRPGGGRSRRASMECRSCAPGSCLSRSGARGRRQFSLATPSSAAPAHRRRHAARPDGVGRLAGADAWAGQARGIAPTIVGGSKKHGGPDLGPTWARRAWAALGVDGLGVADHPRPGLPTRPAAQADRGAWSPACRGSLDGWSFSGRKTAAYRQVGNAFPPPVACALGVAIRRALDG